MTAFVDFRNVWLAYNEAVVPILVMWFGIGYQMQTAGSQQRMPLAFAGLVTIGAMAMYELFSWVEKRTTGWAHRGTQSP